MSSSKSTADKTVSGVSPGNITLPLATAEGGTGLITVGTNGQVLTSNGTGLYYSTITYSTPTALITTSTNAATGATNGTGAIQANSGGAGIGLDLWVGQNVHIVSGNLYCNTIVSSTFLVNASVSASINSVGAATISAAGAATLTGGLNADVLSTLIVNITSGTALNILSGTAMSITSTGLLTINANAALNLNCTGVLTINSLSILALNCTGPLNLTCLSTLNLSCSGILTINALAALNLTTTGILTVNGLAAMTITAGGLLVIGSYVPLLGNTLLESSNSTTVNSAGTLYLTTNNIIAPPLPVLPTFGNIYLECLASYGNIYINTNTGSNGTININSGTGGTIFTGIVTFNSPVVLPNISFGIQSIVSSGGTTTLTASSPYLNVITGSTFHTIVLPATALIPNGTQYSINNTSTGGGVVIQNASLIPITSVPVGAEVVVTLLISGQWDVHFNIPGNTSWGTATLSTSSIIQTSVTLQPILTIG